MTEKTKPSDRASRTTKGVATTSVSANFIKLASVAAGGVALGVAAMIGRKVIVQAPTFAAGDWDQALAAEHEATLALFDALEHGDARNPDRRALLLTQLKHALGKHAIEEENVIYPALREAGHIADADHLNDEHGYVKDYLYRLSNLPNDSAEFSVTLGKFREDIEAHMREEENELFPRLKAQLTADKNARLTAAMNMEGFKLA